MTDQPSFVPGTPVEHERHGRGRVVADLGETVIVRFGADIQQVPADELNVVPSPENTLREGRLHNPDSVLLRAQALAIASVNDQWGVFSRSRVQLLPHQLWVCRKVNGTWPFRWLIADDVGLGKTIEAGLILMPLIASGRVRRLLVLAPASLVDQWQYRLRDMFDIRLQRHASQVDTPKADFWGTASMVAASIHTLRGDRDDDSGRRKRLLDADPWDVVVVDEAHHLYAEERTGDTLAYSLLAELDRRRKIGSLLFFTGTPHRGKDFGFLKLMHLVRPDLFDPEAEPTPQLRLLPKAMIRNNKASATDLQGNKLFTPVTVHNRDYKYSDQEAGFYRTMSEFISDGRAYAANLSGRAGTARGLVLTTLQKLSASSITAVRKTLAKRREMLAKKTKEALAKRRNMPATEAGAPSSATDVSTASGSATHAALPDDATATLDEIAQREEGLAHSFGLILLENEIQRLDELLAMSREVVDETKIERLLKLIEEDIPADEPVLLFTEYKATQALVLNALQRKFGPGSASFINGDDRLDGVETPAGTRTMSRKRQDAADDFNVGKVRFLVSTEAGGEGIDLQENCCHLVHVDMPWNPMRMHQRVGRLSRYGQKRPVTAFTLHNPDTVETRIWKLLNTKLAHIQLAHAAAMDEREDILQLVTGVTSNSMFNHLFAGAEGIERERLDDWFDQETATLGGEDVIDTARNLLGNVARFDFQQVGAELPKVDLPDLDSFFRRAVRRHGHRVFREDDGLHFKSPKKWREHDYAVRNRYEGLVLDRGVRGSNVASRVLGIGHTVFDVALEEALGLKQCVASVGGLANPLLVVSVEDEVTGTGAFVHRLVFGLEEAGADDDAGDEEVAGTDDDAGDDEVAGAGEDAGNAVRVLRDWELLKKLNSCTVSKRPPSSDLPPDLEALHERLIRAFRANIKQHAPMLQRPTAEAEILLVPASVRQPG